MADVIQNSQPDVGSPSLNSEKLQRSRYVAESASVPTTDELVLVPDAANPDEFATPPNVQIYTHDGGLQYTAAGATLAVSDGDTLVLDVHDPTVDRSKVQSLQESVDSGSNLKFTQITHVLAGVTGGAATPAQIVASLEADANVTKWLYMGIPATNEVALFPLGLHGKVKIGQGSTATALANQFPNTTADNALRTFTRVAVAAVWTVTSSVPTAGVNSGKRIVTITNGTGGTVVKVAARVDVF